MQPAYAAPLESRPEAPGVAVGPYRGADARTVLGTPLEPGERVVYFHRPSYRADKIVLIAAGLLLLVVIVGVVLLGLGLFWERLHPRAQIVTTRRILVVDAKGRVNALRIAELGDVDAERRRAGAGGLVGVAVIALANRMARKEDKRTPKFWARTVAVVALGRRGQRLRIPTKRPLELGPLLAEIAADPSHAERAPEVAFEA